MVKIGDIVKLKSGGPEMTVVAFAWFSGKVQCKWGGPMGILTHSDWFPPDSLVKVR